MRTRPSGRVFAFRRTPIVAAIACAFAQGAVAVTFTVSNNADSGPGSLRQAINDANAGCSLSGGDAPVISFSGPFTINASSPMPQFYCSGVTAYNPTIDAANVLSAMPNTSATGFNANIAIVLDGSADFYGGGCAVEYNDNGYGGKLTVKGLEIRNFNYGGGTYGICGPLDLKGSRIVANGSGVYSRTGSIIGGPSLEDRNVIADHMYGSGIEFDGVTAIVNNFIGTRDGSTAAPNETGMRWCFCTQPTGTISGNVIVSTYTGIDLYYDGGMQVSGNKIGTDSTGTSLLGSGSYGISLYYSYGASISGNTIAVPSSGTAIDIYNSGDVVVSGNMIGTNSAGTALVGAGSEGIYDSYSYGTRIDGGNVIGGFLFGVYLSGTTDANVAGNFIGTNSSSASELGNFMGVYIGSVAANNVFDGNVISGNIGGINSSDASDTVFRNNKVGTTADGMSALPNQSAGVYAECGTGLLFENNVISGNSSAGVSLFGIQDSTFNGNFIGVAADGSSALPNTGNGVEMSYTSCGFSDVASQARTRSTKAGRNGVPLGLNESNGNMFVGNHIGKNNGHGVANEGGSQNQFSTNRINANVGDGIRIVSHVDGYGGVISAATGNWMVENVVYGNGGKNINLGFDGGPLPNDAGDADGSPPDIGRPNDWQNKPVVTAVTRDTVNNWTVVDFTLDTQPGTYRIDIFSNSAPGKAGGETYLANTFITVSAPGPASGSYAVPGVSHDYISATASWEDGIPDTSEFAEIMAATTLPVPAVQVLPSSVNFGDVVVGRQSPDSTITISSTGTAPYIISALREDSCTGAPICSTGSFVCSTTCLEATPYSAPNSCTITAAFAPTALGSQTKTLALCDNVVGSPRTVSLTGNGVMASEVDISMSPAEWYFGEVLVGAQSSSKTFTVSNAGTTQVFLGPVRVSGDFSLTSNTCAPTLEAGTSCVASVAFVPVASGNASGKIEVTGSNTAPSAPAALRRNVTASPTTVTVSASLTGTAIQFGDLRLPTSISFGTSTLRASIARQFVNITNTGNGVLTFGGISVTGPFNLVNGCGATLAVGASCTLTLEYNPSTLGTFNGTLTVISDAPGGSRAIPVTAQTIAESRPVVVVNPANIGFGDRVVGTPTVKQRVIVTNEGSQEASLGTLTISSDSGHKDFRIDNTNCAASLAPQASCFADVFMQPVGFGDRTGQLVVPSNSREPAVVGLTGRGCRPFTVGANRSGRDNCAQ